MFLVILGKRSRTKAHAQAWVERAAVLSHIHHRTAPAAFCQMKPEDINCFGLAAPQALASGCVMLVLLW